MSLEAKRRTRPWSAAFGGRRQGRPGRDRRAARSRLRRPQPASRPRARSRGLQAAVAEDHAAFSDIRHIIEEQVAEGDKVVTRIT